MKLKFFPIVFLFLVLSCSFFNESEDLVEFDEEAYWSHYNQWLEADYQNYDFFHEYGSQVVGPQPEVKVVVSNKEFFSSEVTEDLQGIDMEYLILFESVDEIFEEIYKLYESLNESVKSSLVTSANVSVIYDEEYHYPKEVHCGESYNTDIVGGVSIRITINDFYLTDTDEYIDSKISFDKESYWNNYHAWNESEYYNYEFSQNYGSSPNGPQPDVKIIVTNSELNSMNILDENNKYDYLYDHIDFFETITEIYERINGIYEACKRDIMDPNDPMIGASISVSYNETYHYPIGVSYYGSYDGDYVCTGSLSLDIFDFNLIE